MSIIKTKGANVISWSSVAGTVEKKGPLGEFFDIADSKDDRFGKDTWEKSEAEMQRLALSKALEKAGKKDCDIDFLIAGDLINQCISSTNGLIGFDIPFLGVFGACSTCAESILLSSVFSSYAEKTCAAVTSSHNCSAERQFRFPVEYGSLRTPTSQWTVTASGAYVISPEKTDTYVTVAEVMAGRCVDGGITDANNMGAAMAPACADTIERYFSESNLTPGDFDFIVTGDLGKEGSAILKELLKKRGLDISKAHRDCGIDIYDIDSQDMHAGGSGCGCSGSVIGSYYLEKMKQGAINDMLFIGTGALMNAMSVQQGCSIPAVAHLVRFTSLH